MVVRFNSPWTGPIGTLSAGNYCASSVACCNSQSTLPRTRSKSCFLGSGLGLVGAGNHMKAGTFSRHTRHVARVASCEGFCELLTLVELIRFGLGTLCLS